MPIYAYQCPTCGHQMEVLQKSTDAAPECPLAVPGTPMVKQLTAPAFDLKGQGWYRPGPSSGK